MKKKVLLALSIVLVIAIAIIVVIVCLPSDKPNPNNPNNPGTELTEVEKTQLLSYKTAANSELDNIVNPVIAKISDEELKQAVQKFYDDEKQYIENINDLETAKAAAAKVTSDAKAFAINTLKPLGIKKLNDYFNPLIEKLPDEELKSSVQRFYNTEMSKIADVEAMGEIADLYKEIATDVKEFVKTESDRILIVLKDAAIENFDEYIVALIEKIPYEKLKTDTQAFYETEKIKLQNADSIEALKALTDTLQQDLLNFAVTEMVDIATTELDTYIIALIEKIPYDSLKTDTQTFYSNTKIKLQSCKNIDEIESAVKEIKEDLENFAITEAKELAIVELDALVEKGLNKLPNEALKKQLRDYYDTVVIKIMAVTKIEEIKPTLTIVIKETTAFIKELAISTTKEYIKELFTYNLANPYDYIPEAMRPDYKNNFVASPVYDFSTNVSIANMNKQGYGDQWQMVVDNLNQMLIVIKALNVVDASMTTVSNAINIYLENSTSDEIDHTINNDTLEAILSFEEGIFYLEVSFKKSYNVFGIGSISPDIKLSYDINSTSKVVYIALNETNIIKFTMDKDELELASRYGINISDKSASRTSYFHTKKDASGNKYGEIYEYTTLLGYDAIKACANFYVKDGYVSVVGNKADEMMGFKGYINELYSEKEGRLLGYKVQEEVSIEGFTETYHTLWFNLWDIEGINSILVGEKTDENESGKSTIDVYLNGNDKLFVPTYNKKYFVKTSRKYDIELRNRYIYNMVDEKLVKTEMQIPMMFIQDDHDEYTNYSDFSADFNAANGFNAKVIIASEILTKIRSDYNTLIPKFKENIDTMSSDAIIEYLNKFYKNN